jgi:peptide/nickel transport system substrate-binding protein
VHRNRPSGRKGVTSRWLITLALLALAVLVPTASAASRSHASASGTIPQVTWGLIQTVRSLDYTHSGDPGSATVIFLGMQPLVQYDKIGRLEPDLAASFSTPNPTTYVYNLRNGVTFWDGHPLTTADVIYSLQQSAGKTSEISTFFAGVKSMKATGAHQITIKLSSPNPFFRYTMAVTPIGEKAFWSAHLKDIGTPGVMNMGTGPFEFSSFVPSDTVTLTRNPHYWGKEPAIQKLVIKSIVSPSTMLLAIRSHQIDGSFKLPYAEISQYKSLPGVSVQVAPEELPAYLSLDMAEKPFDDVHVREAIAYATDKAGMVKAVLGGYGSPAPTMPPPQQWGDLMSQSKVVQLYKSLPQYTFDMAKAKAEMAASSVPNGFSTTITYPDSSPELGQALQILAQDVKSIGITIDVKQVPHSQWVNVLYTHPTPMGVQVGNWTPDYPDPADALSLIYPSTNAHANSFNTANYKNKAMDALIDEQNNSVSSTVRSAAISKALRLGATDLPYIPLWYQDFAMALNSKYTYTQLGPWYVYQAWAAEISAA